MDMDIYRRIDLVCSRIPRGRVPPTARSPCSAGSRGTPEQMGYCFEKGAGRRGRAGPPGGERRRDPKRAAHFASMDLQCLLLREEGVEVLWTPKGWKTDLKRYGWKNTMEEALELNRAFFSMNI